MNIIGIYEEKEHEIQKTGNTWLIPETAEKPSDVRIKSGKYIKSKIETEDPDRVTLTLHIETDGNDGNDGNPDGNPDGNDGSLTQNEMLVLQVISKTPSLSAARISSQVGFSKSSVERVLRSLKKKE